MSITFVAFCGTECSANLVSDIVQCRSCMCDFSCADCSCSSFNSFIIQKNIQNQTGIQSSTYINNLVPQHVSRGQKFYIQQGLPNFSKNSSDRLRSSNTQNNSIRIIHRNTSSIKGSRTSLKPGNLAPGGIGVDIKHNSYNRHLAKLKSKHLMPREDDHNNNPIRGNKQNNMSVFNYYWNSKCNIRKENLPCS